MGKYLLENGDSYLLEDGSGFFLTEDSLVVLSGILRSDNVIFYHPLDDWIENTLQTAWSGDCGFVEGQVGSGTSAVTADSVSFGDAYTASETTTYPKTIVGLDENTFFAMGKTGAFSGTVDGTAIDFGPSLTGGGFDNYPNTSILMHWDGQDGQVVQFCNYYGSTDLYTITDGSSETRWRYYLTDPYSNAGGVLARLTDTKFIAGGKSSNAGIGAYSCVCTIGTTQFTVGTKYSYPDYSNITPDCAATLDSTHVLLFYQIATTSGYAVVATIDGTGITYGNAYDYTSNLKKDDLGYIGSVAVGIDSSTAVILWSTSSDKKGAARVVTVDGTGITFGDQAYFEPDTGFAHIYHISAAKLDDTTIVVSYVDKLSHPGNYYLYARTGRIDGTNIEFGGRSQVVQSAAGSVGVLSSSKCVFGYPDSEKQVAKIGVLDQAASLSCEEEYPVASGCDRITLGLWSRNLTIDNSEVTVTKDYEISLASGSIALGPDGVVWSGSNVVDVMDNLNNGDNHFALLDFEYTDGDWNLYVSLDGSGYEDLGTQSDGSLDTARTVTNPALEIDDGASNQWIDEIVLWAGDKGSFLQFTDDEIDKTYRLGSLYDKTMDKYGEYTGTPNDSIDLYTASFETIDQSCDLFASGTSPHHSASCDLVCFGPPPAPAVGVSLDWLLASSDYAPQLIGTFTSASTVTIQVWDVSNGANEAVELTSDTCYQIGDTGRWGWSTVNLPQATRGYKHYFYVMTDNGGNTFSGQCVFGGTKPNHPRNMEEYIR